MVRTEIVPRSNGLLKKDESIADRIIMPTKRCFLLFVQMTKCTRSLYSEQEQLDGVDFDWEQPANQEEFIYYLHLIVEASAVFRKEGLLLSVAMHDKQVLPEDVYDAVDRIHLMAYDMKPPSSGDFHFARFDMVQDAVETLLKSGCPSSKIILGIPSYARHVHNHGLVQTYADIIQVHSEDFDRDLTYDDIADFAEYDDFVFQSPMDVETKVGYAKYKNLGGVFFWEIGQDQHQKPFAPGGILLSAAAYAMSEEHASSRDTDGQPKETISAGEL
uniref:GH18 domain-containing protein n=1 Tax=Attheya septentrionalis TaxID=420275 RepID=A0A7S2UMT3_9STRA|mmetsp:Transcript_28925/g.52942  ORF Transcript_28925/g.52942 Transcript_28925/m.52942 type:complete len:274 (+) Transcript_28925:449-1270(+)